MKKETIKFLAILLAALSVMVASVVLVIKNSKVNREIKETISEWGDRVKQADAKKPELDKNQSKHINLDVHGKSGDKEAEQADQ